MEIYPLTIITVTANRGSEKNKRKTMKKNIVNEMEKNMARMFMTMEWLLIYNAKKNKKSFVLLNDVYIARYHRFVWMFPFHHHHMALYIRPHVLYILELLFVLLNKMWS